MAVASTAYPVSFSVDYPERLNRLTTFFRVFMIIPIGIVSALISGFSTPLWDGDINIVITGVSFLFFPTVLMILFRQKYPGWWFAWNLALIRFSARIGVYISLLRDEYPSTDEEQAAHLEITYPDAKRDLNRWLPLVKWLLAIPHLFVLLVLLIASAVCVIIAWFVILFTGRYPRSLFNFVVGVNRWGLRVTAYAFLLTTDRYPPFRLGE